MSSFLSCGNGTKNSFLTPYESVMFTQNNLLSRYSKVEILALSECVKFGDKAFSANQIYKTLKECVKISKDSIYLAMQKFEDELLINFLPKFNSTNKRIYFSDFSLPDALNSKKNFTNKLINALFCELSKLGDEKFYSDKFDIYIPSKSTAFIVVPFTPPELIKLKFNALKNELEKLNITKLFIISMGNSANFSSQTCDCEVLPFWEFALGFDL
jgi:hypothetical protein